MNLIMNRISKKKKEESENENFEQEKKKKKKEKKNIKKSQIGQTSDIKGKFSANHDCCCWVVFFRTEVFFNYI